MKRFSVQGSIYIHCQADDEDAANELIRELQRKLNLVNGVTVSLSERGNSPGRLAFE